MCNNRHNLFRFGYIVKNGAQVGVKRVRVLHLNAGNETGGGMYYLLRTLAALVKEHPGSFVLGVLEKEELYYRAKEQGIPVVYFKGERMFSVSRLKMIVRFIQGENITHVHTHGPRANVLMNLLRRFISVHWIITVHSDPTVDFLHIGWRRHLYTRIHLQAIKKADRIISVCRAFYPTLQKHGVANERLTTITNGINFAKKSNLNEFTIEKLREQHDFTEDDFLFVQVARLEDVKGHQFVLQALAKMISEGYSHVKLLLIGDGSLRAELEKMCEQLSIENYVHFFGECSEGDVAKFYQLADVTLLASLSESFPYVLLESAQARKPVITTDVGDINKLVNHSDLGWLIKPACSHSITEAMKQAIVADASGQLVKKGVRFYNYASENFSLTRCIHAIYKVYEGC